jgi:hypothetical protein
MVAQHFGKPVDAGADQRNPARRGLECGKAERFIGGRLGRDVDYIVEASSPHQPRYRTRSSISRSRTRSRA